MGSKIGFEMSLVIVEAIRGRCASFMSDSRWPRAGLLKNVAPSIVVFATVQRIDYAQIRATVKQPYTKNQHGKFP